MLFNDVYFRKAKEIALSAHRDQKYGEHPYAFHLENVVNVARRFEWKIDSNIPTICWLHDIIEDTTVTEDNLRGIFPPEIVNAVLSVTDFPGETKEDVFSQRTQYNSLGVVVKMADRISNLEFCIAENKKDLLNKYVKEHALFKEILPLKSNDPQMAFYLNDLVKIAKKRIGR